MRKRRELQERHAEEARRTDEMLARRRTVKLPTPEEHEELDELRRRMFGAKGVSS